MRGEEVCKHGLGEHDGGAGRGKPMGAASGAPTAVKRWASGRNWRLWLKMAFAQSVRIEVG